MRPSVHGFVLMVASALLLFAAPVTPARAETIDFTELPLNTEANGATVKGVTFKYTVNNAPSTDAHFTNTGPGTTTISKAPDLEANSAGLLSLDFARPVRDFGLSFVALTPNANPSGFTLTLFDANGGSVTKDIAIAPVGPFAGARFDDPSGGTYVRALVDPNQALGPRFIIDNVTFTPVPEPAAIVSSALVSAGLLLQRRRRAKI